MADEPREPEDIASLMEALWGRRADVPEDDPAAPRDDRGEAVDEAVTPITSESVTVTPPGSAFDGFKAYLDAAFADQLASLRSYVDDALADGLQQVRTEALAVVNNRVSVAMADQLATLRAEAEASVDARFAGAEARLLDRLDGIAAAMAERSEGTAAAVARLDDLERETAERLAALDQLVQPELLRLASAVEDLRQASMTASDLATLGSEALEATETLIAASSRDMKEELDALAASMDEATTSAASAAQARTGAMEGHLNSELVRVTESVEAIRTELAASVSDLETALGRWAADWRADVDARLAGVVREIGPAPADSGRRLRKRKVRRDELQRLVESVAAWRAQSVGPEEFVALRRELEARVERRSAVLDAGSSEVDADTNSAPG